MQKVLKRDDGSYVAIQATSGIQVTIEDAQEVAEITDNRSWENIRKNIGNRKKLKTLIGDEQ